MNTTALQRRIIAELYAKPHIDPEAEVTARVNFLVDYALSTGAKGFTLGISGGQDSTLAGRLCQLAVEELRSRGVPAEFYAMRLPYGTQADEEDAQIALRFIQPSQSVTINIQDATLAIASAVSESLTGKPVSDFNKGNIKARQRMIAQYTLASETGTLVVGSDHAAEAITGFYTKFGDGAADLMPLVGLNKRQGAELLRYLGAPASTWEKVPTADLEEDRPMLSDEEALGVTYAHIDDYLEGRDVPKAAAERIEYLWRASRHKRTTPPGPADTWWRD
ncbi:ammonia-dependent NAD(+) synthetase [Corynebacterium urealyticum]|uniref:ammonia-dependent NAD(+) synthetase n=1 Tax=Corynebacterium urealyticum TaxID=43771 RepID=UPI0002B3FC4B|nr:ammonia-dependent NAD(+) synthetase [Corynebacterium urealyticum]AGE37023.1 NAD-synthetase [Corynebacterium urealyticum DSM 7111]QQB06908.1 ammonia-dependent NAD(+) synthetase [Corynebacterium urealyticum]QQE51549.1 ammonia-dependent NAD(+) synthetase [Corynebacterium urealyticum]